LRRNPLIPTSATATLLLVEDEPDVLQVTKQVLESAGHTVLAAGTADQALFIASNTEGPIDAIITDVVMPGLDGPALVKRLVETLGQIPVLYVSGYTPTELGHDLELGVNCLQKPVRASELLRHVAKLVDPKRTERRRLA
jgi:CheY-like chemotaxis protein